MVTIFFDEKNSKLETIIVNNTFNLSLYYYFIFLIIIILNLIVYRIKLLKRNNLYNLSFNNLNFNHFNSINQIIVSLFFLLPFAIVFSRFFADAIISINSLLFIFTVLKKKIYLFQKK